MSSAYVSLFVTHKYVTINRHGRYFDGSRISIQASGRYVLFFGKAANSRIYSGRRTLRLPSGVTTGAPLLAVTVTVPALVRVVPAVVAATVARAVTAARTVIAAAIVTVTATANETVNETATATGSETVRKRIKTRIRTAIQRQRKSSVEALLRKQRSGVRTAIMR